MDGQGDQMAVLERWKHFKDDENYRQIFQNEELLEYSDKIFNTLAIADILDS